MFINRKIFFDNVRSAPFGGVLTQLNVDGTSAIIEAWEKFDIPKPADVRQLAYILATVFHETAGTMNWAIREFDRGGKRAYAKPTGPHGQIYYGRSWPQLTWLDNYRKMTELANKAGFDVDLVRDPDAILRDPKLAAFVLLEGMYRGISGKGDFTGKALEDYFTGPRGSLEKERKKAEEARRIINGKDKAVQIADLYQLFLSALDKAANASPHPTDVVEIPVDKGAPIAKTESFWGAVLNVIGGGGVFAIDKIFGAINNPYALTATLFCVGLFALGTYMVLSGRIKIAYQTGK